MRHDGAEGTQTFMSKLEARDAALAVEGVAIMSRDPVGSATVFRDGRELDGADASDAFAKFGHTVEVGISRPGEPDENVAPDDATGAGWRAGTPDAWGYRLWKGSDGPGAWVGTYSTREAAYRAAEEAQASDSALEGLPIVDIGPTHGD